MPSMTKSHPAAVESILSMKQVADLFHVEYSTVSQWVGRGRIEFAGRLGEGRTSPIMFDADDVSAWGRELRELYQLRWPEGR